MKRINGTWYYQERAYGLEDCSTLKAIFYDEEFRDYLQRTIDHNLAPENRGW